MVEFSYGLAVMLRSGPLIWVMASCGQAVKFRQGPSGSVELRRVGSRRLRLVMFCWVEVSFGRAVELG